MNKIRFHKDGSIVVYWVALKTDKYNYHSPLYSHKDMAVRCLKTYSADDRKYLKVYSA